MIKAVLLDLDETLLRNPPDTFVTDYLRHFSTVFLRQFPQVDPTQLKQALLLSTQTTVQNTDPLQTNAQVFNQRFMATLKLDSNALSTVMTTFLQDVYPQLQALTMPIDAAPALVAWLQMHDYATAIATNPLFPTQAVYQRLKWAGLDPETPWLVTTLDNMHFTKPQPAYYEEILSRIGVEPDETLMVGDDWENDIIPATQAGLNTFWVQPAATPRPQAPTFQPTGTGTLADLMRLLTEEDWLQTLSPLPVEAGQIRSRFLGNVAALHGTARDVPMHFWHQRPDANEWTPLEVVYHMLESECRVQRPRLETILTEDNPFLPPPPAPPAPGSIDLSTIDPLETVQRFATEREQTIALLTGLTDAQWGRPARHSVFGPTTLLEMAAFTARHDRLHINQLCQTLGKCH